MCGWPAPGKRSLARAAHRSLAVNMSMRSEEIRNRIYDPLTAGLQVLAAIVVALAFIVNERDCRPFKIRKMLFSGGGHLVPGPVSKNLRNGEGFTRFVWVGRDQGDFFMLRALNGSHQANVAVPSIAAPAE